jgi:hypothetical protein
MGPAEPGPIGFIPHLYAIEPALEKVQCERNAEWGGAKEARR